MHIITYISCIYEYTHKDEALENDICIHTKACIHTFMYFWRTELIFEATAVSGKMSWFIEQFRTVFKSRLLERGKTIALRDVICETGLC